MNAEASGNESLIDKDEERTETFLAHYPRSLKLAVTFGVVGLMVWTPFAVGWRPRISFSFSRHVVESTLQASATPKLDGKASFIHGSELAYAPPPQVSGTISSDPVIQDAVRENDADNHDLKLIPSPVSEIAETSSEGDLPRVSENGHKPWQVYARPFNMADPRPRIAIVFSDMGLSNVATSAAVDRLPLNVTLAFDAQSPIIGSWLQRARQVGHETLISLSMEPFDYPRNDPGPRTIFSALPDADNIGRLQWALAQGSGYVGVTTFNGAQFVTDGAKLKPILYVLKQRGLLILDPNLSPHSVLGDLARQGGVPVAAGTTKIDETPSPEAIDASLAQLEKTARLAGKAVGVASPLPVTVDRVEAWAKDLGSRGFVLAPISAVVE